MLIITTNPGMGLVPEDFLKLQARGVKLDGLVHLNDLLDGNVRDQEVLLSQQHLNSLDRLRPVFLIC